MTVDTRLYPYSSIVLVEDTIGTSDFQASGVLLTPDEVLTASHVVYSPALGTATDIEVYPGYSPGSEPYGSAAGSTFHYFMVGNTDDTISQYDTQYDYAIVHLTKPIVGAGTMEPLADFPGGTAHVTGYPASASGSLVDSIQTVSLLPGYSEYSGTALGPGSSGGPVWVGGATDSVVGVVSSADDAGNGYFGQLTSSAVQQIQSWVEADDASQALVDPLFYYANNPDVAFAGVNATQHYEQSGWKEYRDPDAFFSTIGYLAANPDVARAGIDPAIHYDQDGWREGRNPSADFDTTLYLLHNPDVAAAGIDPLQHYLDFGRYEGRATFAAIGPSSSIVAGFDRDYYLLANPDVARAGIDPLVHYETFGWHEGRNPDAVFNTDYYLQQNADVAAAGIDPLLHYETFGWHEGRDPSATFSTTGYLANAPDVAASGIDPLDHYLKFGVYEGRITT